MEGILLEDNRILGVSPFRQPRSKVAQNATHNNNCLHLELRMSAIEVCHGIQSNGQ